MSEFQNILTAVVVGGEQLVAMPSASDGVVILLGIVYDTGTLVALHGDEAPHAAFAVEASNIQPL